MPTTRRSLKRLAEQPVATSPRRANPKKRVFNADDHHGSDEEEEEDQTYGSSPVFMFDGVAYKSYQEMVNAKRKRNEEVMKALGFVQDGSSTNLPTRRKPTASQRGIKKQKTEPVLIQSRKSSRLSGAKASLVALDYNVKNWDRDNSSVVKVEQGDDDDDDDDVIEKQPSFYRGRLIDGSDLTVKDAIGLNEGKWIRDDSVDLAESFRRELVKDSQRATSTKSPTSVVTSTRRSQDIVTQVNDLSIDKQEWVAKVTPDRIYSVAAHPSETKLIACAGDKQGYVGLWDVDGAQLDSDNNNGVHLFHVHSRPVCSMEWITPDAMISASYDGTIRRLNVEAGTFEQIFAAYDDS
eukprot:CAMPEP_0117018582 /NCGR_PEP_ID=MMETSP0472-20121206/14354_1 /TAXON_ID=693140 ORGANISM="Tiarina fusus, Strain LIS" /NCGR_SAMPLE_ID=MMETSP0472 /ASSEMBLY_ACC=CAM_ASM_000603 /LENGTH=350 /DNA_ID=CAMNT_0004723279 /DNA_START=150 /DNA_END=1198 /DNA_ORIENTATION=+